MKFIYFVSQKAFDGKEKQITITKCYALRDGEAGLINRLKNGEVLPITNTALSEYDFGFSEGVVWAEEK